MGLALGLRYVLCREAQSRRAECSERWGLEPTPLPDEEQAEEGEMAKRPRGQESGFKKFSDDGIKEILTFSRSYQRFPPVDKKWRHNVDGPHGDCSISRLHFQTVPKCCVTAYGTVQSVSAADKCSRRHSKGQHGKSCALRDS